MLEISQNLGGHAKHPLYTPKFPQLWINLMIKNWQIIFPKVIYRTPPENAFMNGYFYFYCVVKCGNRALGINEQIKKSSRTQKRTQTHHCCKVIEALWGTRTKRISKESPLGPMTCESGRTKSRRIEWSRNKSEVNEQQRKTWLRNQEWRTTETWMSKT
jgi:hypothetical protein